MTEIFVLLLSIAGGLSYRMGGSGRYPFYFRELGQGLIFAVAMIALGLIAWGWKPILGVFLGIGASFGESTYFKKKGTDAHWINWAAVGAVFGVIPLPYCVATNAHWLGFSVRFIICVSLTVVWQQWLSQPVCDTINKVLMRFNKKPMGKDITDEFGRGFINIATLPLLLV